MRDDVPVMQVYSQENFINNRQDKLQQMNQDAKDIKHIATSINEKIYEQDDKLDIISKEMNKQVDDLKTGNQELVEARILTSKRNKSLACWTLFILILASVLGVSIYFLFFNNKD